MQTRAVRIQLEQQDEVTNGRRTGRRQGEAGYDKDRTTGTRQLQDLQGCSGKLSAPPSPSLLDPLAPVLPHEPVTTPHASTQPATSSTTCSSTMAIPPALPLSGTQTTAQERTSTPPGVSQTPPDASQPPACSALPPRGGYVKLFSLVSFFLIFTLSTTYGTSHRAGAAHKLTTTPTPPSQQHQPNQ